MRILFWSELFWPYIGGVETLSVKLIPALRKRGYEVIVVTSHHYLDLPDGAQYEGIPVYRFPFRAALATRNVDQLVEVRQRVANLKRTFTADLVHINAVGPSVLFHLQTHKAHPAPSLVTMHQGNLPTEPVRRDTLLTQTLRSANWVTCVSSAMLAYVRQLVVETVPRSSVIYNSLEVRRLLPTPLPFEAPRLLCLGRLIPRKGFDMALTAFASLVDRFPRARLVIAGDGPARPELEGQAAALGLADRVDFVGWVAPDKVPELMNTATVVVMPSRQESFGLVALEAAMMARPIVATRVMGLSEVVVHQQTGLLVEPEDSKALAEAISFLLTHLDTAAQLGAEARRRALEMFNWDRCVDAYDALYRRLIQEATHVDAATSRAPRRAFG
jgi:glycosyltransferase involved in cell wall biosynthesis